MVTNVLCLLIHFFAINNSAGTTKVWTDEVVSIEASYEDPLGIAPPQESQVISRELHHRLLFFIEHRERADRGWSFIFFGLITELSGWPLVFVESAFGKV